MRTASIALAPELLEYGIIVQDRVLGSDFWTAWRKSRERFNGYVQSILEMDKDLQDSLPPKANVGTKLTLIDTLDPKLGMTMKEVAEYNSTLEDLSKSIPRGGFIPVVVDYGPGNILLDPKGDPVWIDW